MPDTRPMSILLEFSVGIRVFVIGLCQISSFSPINYMASSYHAEKQTNCKSANHTNYEGNLESNENFTE